MPDVLPLSLAQRRPGRIRPGLEAVDRALRHLGQPQASLRSVLVVGTNGKGSTVAMLDAVLAAHGLTVGRYTSPHLVSVTERIMINGQPISAHRLERRLAELEPFQELTFFETLTGAALLEFAAVGVDVAVLEAGMGGRWDATRIAASEVAGITNVGTDHRAWLGDRPEDIAADKGSALRAARLGVIGPGLDPHWIPFLGAPEAVVAASLVSVTGGTDRQLTACWDGATVELRPPLEGRHQRDNLHLAVALARAADRLGWIDLDAAPVAAGLRAVHWPGRLSWHVVRGRRVLLDGAHNLEAATALVAALGEAGLRPHLVFSCLADKPVEEMAAVLAPAMASVTVCPLEDDRAMPIERLVAAFPDAGTARSPTEAVARAKEPTLAAGSLRLVGALLDLRP